MTTMTTMTRFKVQQVHQDQFEVWDMSIPDILACYDNQKMAQAHADAALKSYNKAMSKKGSFS